MSVEAITPTVSVADIQTNDLKPVGFGVDESRSDAENVGGSDYAGLDASSAADLSRFDEETGLIRPSASVLDTTSEGESPSSHELQGGQCTFVIQNGIATFSNLGVNLNNPLREDDFTFLRRLGSAIGGLPSNFSDNANIALSGDAERIDPVVEAGIPSNTLTVKVRTNSNGSRDVVLDPKNELGEKTLPLDVFAATVGEVAGCGVTEVTPPATETAVPTPSPVVESNQQQTMTTTPASQGFDITVAPPTVMPEPTKTPVPLTPEQERSRATAAKLGIGALVVVVTVGVGIFLRKILSRENPDKQTFGEGRKRLY